MVNDNNSGHVLDGQVRLTIGEKLGGLKER